MRLAGLICLGLGLYSPGLAAPASGALFGDWLTADQTGVIRLEPCGGTVCARIVGMTWPPNGSVPRDVHGLSQCHMLIMRGVRQKEANLWSGSIDNPNDGNSYDAELWLDESGRLHLRGYIVLPLFGSTQIWTRYSGPVPPDCHLR